MAGQRVTVDSGLFQTAISTAARNTYETTIRQLGALGGLFSTDAVNSRTVELGYYHSAPMPVLQRRGDPIREAGFASTSYEGTVLRYGIEIAWDIDDASDDQLGGLETRANDAAKRFALLDLKAAELYLRGATDPDVIPALTLCPDGVALFSATDGTGAARFTVTGGNIVNGTGYATHDDIEADLYSAQIRFASMLDTEGEQLHVDSLDSGGYTILYPVAHRRVFEKAFKQSLPIADQGTVNEATSNIIIENGVKYILRALSPDVTGNSWWILANGCTVKPLTILNRGAMTTVPFDERTDGEARRNNRAGVAFKLRRGWVPNLPYGAIKVYNA